LVKPQSLADIRREARENWLRLRQDQQQSQGHSHSHSQSQDRSQNRDAAERRSAANATQDRGHDDRFGR
jgi:hypothetical protein